VENGNSKLKELLKPEYLKHPISNKKLKSIDIFSTDKILCNTCNLLHESTVYIIHADLPSIEYYVVIKCLTCSNLSWYIKSIK
jgi:hypothetical protein